MMELYTFQKEYYEDLRKNVKEGRVDAYGKDKEGIFGKAKKFLSKIANKIIKPIVGIAAVGFGLYVLTIQEITGFLLSDSR